MGFWGDCGCSKKGYWLTFKTSSINKIHCFFPDKLEPETSICQWLASNWMMIPNPYIENGWKKTCRSIWNWIALGFEEWTNCFPVYIFFTGYNFKPIPPSPTFHWLSEVLLARLASLPSSPHHVKALFVITKSRQNPSKKPMGILGGCFGEPKTGAPTPDNPAIFFDAFFFLLWKTSGKTNKPG